MKLKYDPSKATFIEKSKFREQARDNANDHKEYNVYQSNNFTDQAPVGNTNYHPKKKTK